MTSLSMSSRAVLSIGGWFEEAGVGAEKCDGASMGGGMEYMAGGCCYWAYKCETIEVSSVTFLCRAVNWSVINLVPREPTGYVWEVAGGITCDGATVGGATLLGPARCFLPHHWTACVRQRVEEEVSASRHALASSGLLGSGRLIGSGRLLGSCRLLGTRLLGSGGRHGRVGRRGNGSSGGVANALTSGNIALT